MGIFNSYVKLPEGTYQMMVADVPRNVAGHPTEPNQADKTAPCVLFWFCSFNIAARKMLLQ